MTRRAKHVSSRARRNRVLTISAWLAVLGIAAFVIDTLPATAADGRSCPASPSEDQLEIDDTPPGQFDFPSEDRREFHLRFDESREQQRRILKFEGQGAEAGKTPINTKAELEQDLESSDGLTIEEGGGLTIVAWVEEPARGAHPSIVKVCVAIDPDAVPNLHPGRYEGNVVLKADNFRFEKVPIVVTFRAPRSQGIKFAFGGVVIGLAVKMLTELGSGKRSGNPGGRHALRNYLFQWSFPLTILLGIVTGWVAYIQIYDANPTWGVGGADSLKLFAACLGFQMGSIGGADMAKRVVG